MAFSPINTIGRTIDLIEYPIDPGLHKGVYTIPCSCGKVYIGEMGRSMRVRFKEHITSLKLNIMHKYTLDEHSWMTSHHICMEDAKMIEKVDHYGKIKRMESLVYN